MNLLPTRLLRLLQVQEKEYKIFSLVVLFGFLIGVASNILYSVPLAMFLTLYSTTYLPYIYIGVGIAMFFLGIGMNYLEKKFSTFYVLALPLAGFSVLLFLIYCSLYIIKSNWIFLILQILSLVIAYFIAGFIGLVSNQVFTLQQNKRLFGPIIGGSALGGVCMGFALKFVVNTIGIHHTLLLSLLLLLCTLWVQFLIKKHSEKDPLHPVVTLTSSSKAPATSISNFKHKKYILQVFVFTFAVYFMYYYFELLFNTEAQKHFSNELQLAAFFGVLYAFCDLGGIFAGFVLSPWVLSRFGLLVSLAILPMGLFLLLSGAFLTNLVTSATGFIFTLLFITSVFESLMRDYITEESILMLFQPLKTAERMWAQLKIVAIMQPLSIAIIGAFLLIINRYFPVEISIASLAIITLAIITTALIFFSLKRGYLTLLIEALSKIRIINPEFIKLTKENLSVLQSRLTSTYPEEIIYVLQTIENTNRKEFEKTLFLTLNNPLKEVRSFTLMKIEELQIKSMKPALKEFCLHENDPIVLKSAILALGSLTDSNDSDELIHYLSSAESAVISGALIALIKYGSEKARTFGIEYLVNMVHSVQKEENFIAATALKDVDIPIKNTLLLSLLTNAHLEIRVSACEAICYSIDEKIYHALIKNLATLETKDAAFYALKRLDVLVLDFIIKDFKESSLSIQIAFIHLLGVMKENRSLDFLRSLLSSSHRKIVHSTLLFLKKRSYQALEETEIETIKNLLKSEGKNISHLIQLSHYYKDAQTKLLHDLLLREIEISQECCFCLLSFIYDKAVIEKVILGFSLKDEHMASNCVELLLQILDAEDQSLLMFELTYGLNMEEKQITPNTRKIEECLLETFDYASHYFISELIAAIVYTIGLMHLKTLTKLVLKETEKKDPLMQETAKWAIDKLKKSA